MEGYKFLAVYFIKRACYLPWFLQGSLERRCPGQDWDLAFRECITPDPDAQCTVRILNYKGGFSDGSKMVSEQSCSKRLECSCILFSLGTVTPLVGLKQPQGLPRGEKDVIVAAVCPTTVGAPALLFQHSLVTPSLIMSNCVACAGFMFQTQLPTWVLDKAL